MAVVLCWRAELQFARVGNSWKVGFLNTIIGNYLWGRKSCASNQRGRRLKLRDLQILLTVAEYGTMGRAAQILAVSQPVVSQAISDLERAVGVRLLDRSPRGVTPTAHGRALIKGAGIAIFDEMQQGLKDLEKLSDPGAGEVSIGATASAAAAIVSPVIERLSRQYPRMRFRVLVANSTPLFDALELRRIELAISRPPRPLGDEYNMEVLFHNSLAVITSKKTLWRGGGGV